MDLVSFLFLFPYILATVVVIGLFIFLFWTLFLHYDRNIHNDVLNHYPILLEIMKRGKDTAYQKIYRDYILVQTASGMKVGKEDLKRIQKEYIKLVFQCCGKRVIQDLKLIYGDLDSLCTFLLNDFILRVEMDEHVLTTSEMNQKEI